MRLLRGGPLFLLIMACEADWRPADLQVDVTGTGLSDEDLLRVCITGVTVHEEAVGAGRVAVTALPVEGVVGVSLSAFRAETHVGDSAETAAETTSLGFATATLSAEEPYVEVPWQPCGGEDSPDGCEPCFVGEDGRVDRGEDSRVLAIRLDGR